MRTEQTEPTRHTGEVVMQTFVRGPIAGKPEFRRTTEDGIGVCRLAVTGEAVGPASSPPRVTLYIRDGGEGLRADEARRCDRGLREGDVIEAVGNVGAERANARNQEVIVTERVKLRARAAGTAGAA